MSTYTQIKDGVLAAKGSIDTALGRDEPGGQPSPDPPPLPAQPDEPKSDEDEPKSDEDDHAGWDGQTQFDD
jgi:hypothetical protein